MNLNAPTHISKSLRDLSGITDEKRGGVSADSNVPRRDQKNIGNCDEEELFSFTIFV